jgi:hypothetical protein
VYAMLDGQKVRQANVNLLPILIQLIILIVQELKASYSNTMMVKTVSNVIQDVYSVVVQVHSAVSEPLVEELRIKLQKLRQLVMTHSNAHALMEHLLILTHQMQHKTGSADTAISTLPIVIHVTISTHAIKRDVKHHGLLTPHQVVQLSGNVSVLPVIQCLAQIALRT